MNYNTKQRELILNCLMENSDKHLNAFEIMELLKVKKINVGQATIYRTLEKLIKENIVIKYITKDNSACYQYIADDNCVMHNHLICSECGELIHIEGAYLDRLSEYIETEYGFLIDKFRTVFYGKCKSCGGQTT